MKHPSLLISLLFAAICFLPPVRPANLYYMLLQDCIDPGPRACNRWNNTVNIFYNQDFYIYMCFPESTRVLTPHGAKQINHLQVGDRILAYSSRHSKPIYSPVTAWLHRDTDAFTHFTSIVTQDGRTYLSSGGHNIAYVNKEGQISFKFAEELREGDELLSLGGASVVRNAGRRSGYGLYSPMTQESNFYIFNHEDESGGPTNMILVSCFSDVANGGRTEHLVSMMLAAGHIVGANGHENKQHEEYQHPITHLFPLLGSKSHSVTYHLELDSENNLVHKRRQPDGQHGRSVSEAHERTSSSSSQKQQKKKQVVSLYASLMQLNSLILNS